MGQERYAMEHRSDLRTLAIENGDEGIVVNTSLLSDDFDATARLHELRDETLALLVSNDQPQ